MIKKIRIAFSTNHLLNVFNDKQGFESGPQTTAATTSNNNMMYFYH